MFLFDRCLINSTAASAASLADLLPGRRRRLKFSAPGHTSHFGMFGIGTVSEGIDYRFGNLLIPLAAASRVTWSAELRRSLCTIVLLFFRRCPV